MAWRCFLGAALIGALLVAANVSALDPATAEGRPYVSLYDPPSTPLEVLLNQGDGQAFAALAQDPALQRPEVFSAGRPELAYRAQRPLLSALAWGLSAGQAGLVPLALVVVTVASFAALAAVAAAMGGIRAVAACAAPGAIVVLDTTGPELLAATAVLGGVWAWRRDRTAVAVLLFVAAALARETTLVAPAAIAAYEAVARRRVARLLPLAVPFAAYGLWVLVVRWRVGAWPTDTDTKRLSGPFVGLAEAAPDWSAADWLIALGGVALVVAAMCTRQALLVVVAVGHVAASAFFGEEVWKRFEDFGRVLLPMHVCAIVALAQGRRRNASSGAVAMAGPSSHSGRVTQNSTPGASGTSSST